jgi:hypothetical protein
MQKIPVPEQPFRRGYQFADFLVPVHQYFGDHFVTFHNKKPCFRPGFFLFQVMDEPYFILA